MERIKIGLLDFGQRSNLNSLQGVDDLINYAVQAEKLGFSRLWLGEHHTTSPTCIWSNPEMLLPVLAGMTDKIKIVLRVFCCGCIHHIMWRVILKC